MARTMDEIAQEQLGAQAMTIVRLQWQVEDLMAQVKEAKELYDSEISQSKMTNQPWTSSTTTQRQVG
jgi:hypothetical protein